MYVSATTQGGNIMSRKEMVRQLAEHLGIQAKYLGVPSFAYQVGDFMVDRDGLITDDKGEMVELEMIISGEAKAVEEPTATEEITTIEVGLPLDGHDTRTLKNLINMIYSRQELIKKALKITDDMVDKKFVEELKTVEPRDLNDFINLSQGKCCGIHFAADTVTFISHLTQPDEIKAFTDFIGLLNVKAKALKYASAKPVITDNEKYTFRAWLMWLGMIGVEYKIARKVLLQNLSGNTAFRKRILDTRR